MCTAGFAKKEVRWNPLSSTPTWDVAVNLVAERDPYTMTPDPLIATGTVRAEAVGDAHRFHIRESETLTWFGGDRTMAALARKIIDEVTR